MANVKRCDRCGAVYPYSTATSDPNAVRMLKINTIGAILIEKTPRDLCPSCIAKLESFLNHVRSFTAMDKVQKAYDILTAHPFVDDDPHKAIEEAIGYLGEALDS